MNAIRIGGMLLLLALWIWLSVSLFRLGGGITLKNIFSVGASGIIIFLPLWRKYVKPQEDRKK